MTVGRARAGLRLLLVVRAFRLDQCSESHSLSRQPQVVSSSSCLWQSDGSSSGCHQPGPQGITITVSSMARRPDQLGPTAASLRERLDSSTREFQQSEERLPTGLGPLVQARVQEFMHAREKVRGPTDSNGPDSRNLQWKKELENIIASRKLPVKKIAELVEAEITSQMSETLLTVARGGLADPEPSVKPSAPDQPPSRRSSARSLPLPKQPEEHQPTPCPQRGTRSSAQPARYGLLDFMDALRDMGLVPHKLSEEDAVLAFSGAAAAAGGGGDALDAEQFQDLLADLIRVGLVDFVEALQGLGLVPDPQLHLVRPNVRLQVRPGPARIRSARPGR